MVTISVAKAKAGLSGLLERAESGEEVVITRHGKPVARLSAVEAPKKKPPSLAEFRKRAPAWSKASVKLLRQMRDEGL
ncbi:MAG: type II toxin-antitoxin system prevent-host-death family antitoxin [Nitrospinae bacterium]|nr:type II toxin-antitoxin system prevent-host-death family antitoxin [Nitrospinota bacterium]